MGRSCRGATYLTVPAVNSIAGSMTLPSTTALETLNTASVMAIESQMDASASCMPGQMLEKNMSELVETAAGAGTHRRPKPNTIVRGSVSGSWSTDLTNRSGLKVKGSG